ncbi:MAG: hypothetical protein H6581_24265 [Bacteroidia bacterium]|nr:hypothetical protein [Bacteroidia bacterium]
MNRPSQPDQVTDYVGSCVYENSTLEFFFTAEGRAVPDASLGGQFRYEYYYTDHPGNTRPGYSDLNGDGKVTKTEIIPHKKGVAIPATPFSSILKPLTSPPADT